ncbi:MAG: TetR family transcriptional regulator [Deltaproteobacteria bacterium]|nr:TetR family transcriptional regulator [Deltaproteobacteria bacterium]
MAETRRTPRQDRSKKRVERILDAAAHVFAEEGYAAATMEGIAARAETSIGSIYQFFPNKLAVFTALAQHYHAKLRVFFDLLLGGPLLERPWHDILDEGIDALAAFHEQEVGFRAVWVGLQLTEQVVAEGEAINREFARRIEAVLAAKLPGLPRRTRPVVATMMVEVLTAMLIVSARRPAEAKALLAETKELLKRYLAPYEPAKPKVRSSR